MQNPEDDVEFPSELAPGESPFERHVFVCTHGKVCPMEGSFDLHTKLKLAAKAALGSKAVRVNKSGCLSQCGYGPIVVVYPEGTWYAGVTEADVDELVSEHLVAGRPVERLLFRGHKRGKNIRPSA